MYYKTQEIWAGTKKVGCGLAFQSREKVIGGRTYNLIYSYVVARYSPPGNRKNAMGFNIHPPEEGG